MSHCLSNRDFLLHYAKISYQGNVDYLLSYPRSGNTLVRYIFEFIVGRPTMELRSHHDLLNIYLAQTLKELKIDRYARPLWKVHRNRFITAQKFYDPDRTRLVFLLRNYKEIAFRYSQFRDFPLFDSNDNLIEENLKKAFSIWDDDDTRELYFKNIEFFDQCDDAKRLLIYYEDLINYPFEVIDRITNFFDGFSERALDLKQNYAYYQNRIHNFYNEHELALSQNDDVRYYSKQISFNKCVMIDEWVKKNHFDLWPYIRHYEECNFRQK